MGTLEVKLETLYVEQFGKPTHFLTIGEPFAIVIRVTAAKAITDTAVLVSLQSDKVHQTFANVIPLDLSSAERIVHGVNLVAGVNIIRFEITAALMGDGGYQAGLSIFPAANDHKYTPETSYCEYKKVLSFQAGYRSKRLFGRGTLCELPVSKVTYSPG